MSTTAYRRTSEIDYSLVQKMKYEVYSITEQDLRYRLNYKVSEVISSAAGLLFSERPQGVNSCIDADPRLFLGLPRTYAFE